MDGNSLKVQRVTERVRANALASKLSELYPASKWSPSKVSRIEAAGHVEPELVAEYVAGLATFTTNTTAAA